MKTLSEFQSEMRSFVRYSPPATGHNPNNLKGFWTPVYDGDAFICQSCASRLLARGFSLPNSTPCYENEPYGVCVVCE